MASNLAVTAASFDQEVLESSVPVLVDFWATWCGPCKAIAPAIEELATELAGVASVRKVDVDSEGDLAMRYGVMSIPTLIVFKNGQEVDRMVGALPKTEIRALVERHK